MIFWKKQTSVASLLALKELVNTRQLEITHIISPPRTASTIFAIALSEGADGFTNEPFLKIKISKHHQGYDAVLARANELLQQSTARPVKLIIKDIAHSFSTQQWQQWMPLVQNFAIIVRDPHLQTYSLMERSTLKMEYKNLYEFIKALVKMTNSADRSMIMGLMKQHIKQCLRTLLHRPPKDKDSMILSAAPHIENFIISFNKRSYNALISHLYTIEEHLKSAPEKSLILVDALCLKIGNDATISTIASTFNLHPINGKKLCKSVGTNFHDSVAIGGKDDNGITLNIWHREATSSTHIKPLDAERDKPKPLSWFPAIIQNQITDIYLPIYVQILTHPNIILPPLEAILKHSEIQIVTPITTYTILHALKKETKNHKKQDALNCILAGIHTKNPQHTLALSIIDRTI